MIFNQTFKKIINKINTNEELTTKIKLQIIKKGSKTKPFINYQFINSVLIVSACFIVAFLFIINQNKSYSNNDSKYNNHNYILKYEPNNLIDSLYSYNLADNKVMYKLYEHIAIIKITSIDGVTNKQEVGNAFTYGKATILSTLKGEINKEYINFKRPGGIMSFKEWLKGEPPKGGLEPVEEDFQVDTHYPDDIHIENNKTYLVYLYPDKTFKTEDYWIAGAQFGLREILNPQEEINSTNLKNLKVKNNHTGKWENITSVIPHLK